MTFSAWISSCFQGNPACFIFFFTPFIFVVWQSGNHFTAFVNGEILKEITSEDHAEVSSAFLPPFLGNMNPDKIFAYNFYGLR